MQTKDAHDLETVRDLIQRRDRNWGWTIAVYDALPRFLFHNHGSTMRPDRRPYVTASLAQPSADKSFTLAQIANVARDQFYGIALHTSTPAAVGDPPHVDICFGAVWSYLVNGHLGGSAEEVRDVREAVREDPKNPQDVLSGEIDTVSLVKLRSDVLPVPVFHRMMAELIQWKPEAQPECYVYQRLNRVMKTSVMISPGVEYNREEGLAVLDQLAWLMPPFLQLCLPPKIDKDAEIPSSGVRLKRPLSFVRAAN